MDIQIIRNPAPMTLDIVASRSKLKFTDGPPGALGLVQGKVIEMIVASDIAEKSSDVEVSDIRGLCPQHFTMLVIAGDISAVEEALKNIESK